MGATLAEAIQARDALRRRYRGAPWLRGLGIGLHARGDTHVRARVRAQSGEWETADPTIVNSTLGKLPRHALTALPAEPEPVEDALDGRS